MSTSAAAQAPSTPSILDANWKVRWRECTERYISSEMKGRQYAREETDKWRGTGNRANFLRALACRVRMAGDAPAPMRAEVVAAIQEAKSKPELSPELFELLAGYVETIMQDDPADESIPGYLAELERLSKSLGDGRQSVLNAVRGMYATNAGKFSEGLEQLSAAIEQPNSDLDLAINLHKRAITYIYSANRSDAAFKSAWTDLDRAAEILDPKKYRTHGVVFLYTRGMLFLEVGEYEKARSTLEEAYHLSLQPGVMENSDNDIAIRYAHALTKTDDPRRAIEVLDAFGDIRRLWRYPQWRIALEYVHAYSRTPTPSAFEKGSEWLKLAISQKQDTTDAHKVLQNRVSSEFYGRHGQYKQALEALRTSIEAEARLQRMSSARAEVEFQTKLNFAKKEAENAALRSDAVASEARQRAWFVAFAVVLLGAITVGVALAFNVRQRRRLASVSAELERKNEELQEKNSDRIRLVAAASHDLRQPAHAIGVFAEIAPSLRAHPESFDEWLGNLHQCSSTLSDMLAELMDLGRLEGGFYTPTLQDVPVSDLFQEVSAQFEATAGRKGLRLVIQPTEYVVRTDRHLLRRMVLNLVSNAIRYTDSGWIEVGTHAGRTNVRISVKDTGPGIPRERLDAPLSESLSSTSPDGLGIGLSIVRRAAALLGHDLEINSQQGQGTEAVISVPLAVRQSGAIRQEAARAEPPSLSPFKIALVEDDFHILAATTRLLESWGATVCAGQNADAVVADGLSAAPDLIIADLRLRGTCGLEQIARLRERFNPVPVPAILLTGDLHDSTAKMAIEHQVRLVHKPISPTRLLRIICDLLAGEERSSVSAHGGATSSDIPSPSPSPTPTSEPEPESESEYSVFNR